MSVCMSLRWLYVYLYVSEVTVCLYVSEVAVCLFVCL